MRKLLLFISLILVFLLSSCTLHEDPRAMASTKIALTYDGIQCTPYESFVPQGQEIEITLTNESDFDITWYLVFGPIDGKFEELNPENILASANGNAGQVTISTFTAPYLPARYDSFCVHNENSDLRALTYLLVVQPYGE
jgi:hypothetical protein